MCVWHEDVLRLDTEDELFKQLHPGVEAEANFGAGHLIFQGGRFHRVALQDQVSIRTPVRLGRPARPRIRSLMPHRRASHR